MIRRKEITLLPVTEHVEYNGDAHWIGRAQMYGDAIVVDAYDARKSKSAGEATFDFRWVCDGKNYASISRHAGQWQMWTTMGLCTSMTKQRSHYYYCSSQHIELDDDGEAAVRALLEHLGLADNFGQSWAKSAETIQRGKQLESLEYLIRDHKMQRSNFLRDKRLQERIDQIEEYQPKDWMQWIDEEVFRRRYMFYDGRKRTVGYCAHCKTTVTLSGRQRHNALGTCPHCHSEVQYKAKGRCKEAILDTCEVAYMQKIKGGLGILYLQAAKRSTSEGESYGFMKNAFQTRLDNGKKYMDYCMYFDYSREERWRDTKPQSKAGWNPKGVLYCHNLPDILEGTAYRYAPLPQMAKRNGARFEVSHFLDNYLYAPQIEYFVKMGLYRLTDDICSNMYDPEINYSGRRIVEILRISKASVDRLVRMDGSLRMLKWLQYAEAQQMPINDEELLYLDRKVVVTPRNCERILEAVKSVKRMVNYLKKQRSDRIKSLYAAVEYWGDYLSMAHAADMDLSDDIVRFPKDLVRYHDRLMDLTRETLRKEKEEREKAKYAALNLDIAKRLADAEQYRQEIGQYIVIPAQSCEELITEGQTLHHCVGSSDTYMKRMASGKTWILFLRRKEEPEKAYYTIEIDCMTGNVNQWYSEFDRKPNKDEIAKVIVAIEKRAVKRALQARIKEHNDQAMMTAAV